jgi:Tfp pilus assembly protein PilO
MDFNTLQIKEIGVWPLWVKGMTVLVAMVFAMLLIYYFFIEPQLHALDFKRKQLTNDCKIFAEQYSKFINVNVVQQQIIFMRGRYVAYTKVPGIASVADCIESLTKLADQNHLQITTIKPGEVDISAEFYKLVAIHLMMVGTYHEFARFISGIAAFAGVVGMGDFVISREDNIDDDTEQLVINVNIYLEVQ